MSRIYIASDHAGFELKDALSVFLKERGYEVSDLGASTFEPQDDYPDYLGMLGREVAQNKGSFGLGIGGSGQGEAMAANRTPGARAAVFYGPSFAKATGGQGSYEIVKVAREHNDANILCLGARFVSADEAKEAVMLFLITKFSGAERHARRIAKLG
jgi:ribose 5-phosphate isomerase B